MLALLLYNNIKCMIDWSIIWLNVFKIRMLGDFRFGFMIDMC